MLKRLFKKVAMPFQMWAGVHELRKGNAILQAQEYARLKREMAVDHAGNVALDGYKVYSQTDEDGIIAAIFDRFDHGGAFVEIGVQTGVECNSLLLLLKGWRGTWIEGSSDACATIRADLGAGSFANRFRITDSFVTRENIADLLRDAMRFLEVEELDFYSLDIDGNDLHCMRAMFEAGITPKVVCVEYQGKFPPPVSVTVDYAPDHVWDGTDYMGTSLQAFVDLFEANGYRLVTCNIPGINAFFVRNDLASHFADIPVASLWQPYRAWLSPFVPGQVPSLKYLRSLLHSG